MSIWMYSSLGESGLESDIEFLMLAVVVCFLLCLYRK